MGCGCLIALAAALSPRFATFLLWIFTDRMSEAFSSFWIGLLGWLLLPWTTLAWAVAYDPFFGVRGFGWFIVILAFVVDITTHFGADRARRERSLGGSY